MSKNTKLSLLLTPRKQPSSPPSPDNYVTPSFPILMDYYFQTYHRNNTWLNRFVPQSIKTT